MSTEVRDMFSDIAGRYDLANDLLSMGTHRHWRKAAFAWGAPHECSSVLDLCCGTGDFALIAAARTPRPDRIIGVDISEGMLQYARQKLSRCSSAAAVDFVCADALNLPFDSDSFDCITNGFGVRNFDDPLLGLKESCRVLKPGATLLVLEFGRIESKLVSFFYTPYASHILPMWGGLITGNKSAYDYLHRTSLSFPGGAEFLPLLEEAGFSSPRYRAFWGGIAYAYAATK